MNREGYRTYVSSRPFGGMAIPVPVQNIYLRSYAQQKGLMYKLSVNEYKFDGCYLQLEAALTELPALEGILMSSIHMLPRNPRRRRRIYDILAQNEAEMHFALEDIAIRKPGDEVAVETLLRTLATIEQCPKDIPRDLLPPAAHNGMQGPAGSSA